MQLYVMATQSRLVFACTRGTRLRDHFSPGMNSSHIVCQRARTLAASKWNAFLHSLPAPSDWLRHSWRSTLGVWLDRGATKTLCAPAPPRSHCKHPALHRKKLQRWKYPSNPPLLRSSPNIKWSLETVAALILYSTIANYRNIRNHFGKCAIISTTSVIGYVLGNKPDPQMLLMLL